MKHVYVLAERGMLRRSGGRFILQRDQRDSVEFAADTLSQLVLGGRVTLTAAAIELLLERSVDTVLLDRAGKFLGRLSRSRNQQAPLRLAQYQVTLQPERALEIGKSIVRAKAQNQRALLQRAHRRQPDERLATGVYAMRGAIRALGDAQTMDEIRGIEGAAAAAYFRVFDALLRADGIRFTGRNRRPPLDPVNCLLSFGYTLLYQQMCSALEVVGLDPTLGFLHVPQSGRDSLALDVMEVMRAPIVDAMVVAAFNQRVLRLEHFEEAGEGEPVVLQKEGSRAFVDLFARRMERRVLDPRSGKRWPWRLYFIEEARAVARWVQDQEPYVPFQIR